jgi:hypothetical protein
MAYFLIKADSNGRFEPGPLVLAALAAGGENATYRPVQVQKLVFLIDREASRLVDGPHFGFQPYDYGPFDRAVYIELDSLHTQGLVNAQNTGGIKSILYLQKVIDKACRTFVDSAIPLEATSNRLPDGCLALASSSS